LWVVPLSSLPGLKAQVRAGSSGQSEITVSLIALNGRLLAQAKTTLVIEPEAADTGAARRATKPLDRAEGAAPRAPEPAPIETPGGAASAPSGPALQGAERTRAEHLLALGEAYLADGNVMGARDFFERAAGAGLPGAAMRMAATYDPAELEQLNAHGVAADLALARKWYERARELGAAEAAERLARLGGN
jgi:TPR repeat protein